MRSFQKIMAVLIFLNVWPMPKAVFADDIASIEKRLEDLEQQVADLKQELWKKKQGPSANVTINGKEGFTVKSTDGNYNLKIGGYAQVLSRQFATNGNNQGFGSSIIPRRIRIQVQGTVARDFDYYIQPEFGYTNTYSSITATAPTAYAVGLQDAWIDWKYFPWATVKAGKFKTPFDLENLQDTRYTAFPEIGITGNLSPQRDIGLQIGGSVLNDMVNYAGGVFDGAADRENTYGGWATAPGDTNEKSGTGRIFLKPFTNMDIEPLKGFGIGYAVSYGKTKGSDIPSYFTTGQVPVFTYNSNVTEDGPQVRSSPQASYYYKSIGILAEKVNSQQELEYKGSGLAIYRDKPTNRAWELTGTYALTGEEESYNGITPLHDFDLLSRHWGAFELAGRYGELKLDSSIFSENFANLNTSISLERTWGTGINWYLNHNIKLVFDFEQTKFRRGAVNGASSDDRKTENLYTAMFQLGF